MRKIALVTAARAGDLDEDMVPLLKALPGTEPVIWDDPRVDWSAFDAAIVRSTWDYASRRDEFLRWAGRASRSTRLWNPEPILRWNTDKRYLRGLSGLPVVPTHWIEPSDRIEIPFGGEFVVKPSISAGAKDTARYGDPAAGREHILRLQREGRTVMVQPYLKAVDDAGETGLVYLGGEYSHAIRKGPILLPSLRYVEGMFAKEDISARTPSAAERDLAERVIDRVPGGRRELLYARVDVAPGPMLLELEATEPSLFLGVAPGSAERLARAILARLES